MSKSKKYVKKEVRIKSSTYYKKVKLNPNKTYYKILKLDYTHNGYKYNLGLNKLKNEKFSEKGYCVKGGLYFTNKYNIHRFFKVGVHLCKVKIQEDANVVKVRCNSSTKFRTDKLIIEKIYPLYSPITIAKFRWIDSKNMVRHNSKNYYYFLQSVLYAASNGDVDYLRKRFHRIERLSKEKRELSYELACREGHLQCAKLLYSMI